MSPAGAPSICRDCEAVGSALADGRCRACGSPRILRHPELADLAIAHVDCDAFYATIEKRDRPELRDVPVIVGGGRRGVVLTACYIARINGVRSAMPMFKALEACPRAVVVKPRMEVYGRVGREVREMMRALTPLVEPVSIDEAYLDLSGTERVHRATPALSLVRFARQVEREVGITVSIGLSANKFLAKIASDLGKPRGFSVIGRNEAATLLAEKPIGIIPGIGKQTEKRLARAGVTRVGQLANAHLAPQLAGILGRDAARLARLSGGEDRRSVEPVRVAKSVSAETTFSSDLSRAEELEPILWRLCEKVSGRLKASSLAGASVTLKLKSADFRIVTRTRSGLAPTQLANRLWAAAHPLLLASLDGTAYRLLGIGAGDLKDAREADQGDLADATVHEERRREAAIDAIREKFGAESLQKGIAFRRLPGT